MTLGRHLRELSQLRTGLLVSLCLALLAATWSVGKISLFPPGLKTRSLAISAASTKVLVDAPQSAVADVAVNTVDIQAMTNKALVVGNVMGSEPVRSYILRRAQLPTDAYVQITSPVTPDFPRELSITGTKSTTDILKSPHEYRLDIEANPTIPELDLYAEAPTPAEAARIANGAVEGMQDYLRTLAGQQHVPAEEQVTLRQLGTAKGGVVDPGVNAQLASLTFILVFVASGAVTLWLARVREGWNRERALHEQLRAST